MSEEQNNPDKQTHDYASRFVAKLRAFNKSLDYDMSNDIHQALTETSLMKLFSAGALWGIAAGGFAGDANPDAVNLAAPIVDGERVYIPAVGEPTSDVATSNSAPEVWPININSADAIRLEDLPGVGPATSALIIAYRDQHGPFASVEQLADVRGIGPAKLDAIRALVTV